MNHTMMSTQPDITTIFELQKAHFLAGKTLSMEVRKEYLRDLKRSIKVNETRIAEAIAKDFGKSYFEVIENEISLVNIEIGLTLRRLRRWSAPYRPLPGISNIPGRCRVYAQPFGTVLCISPWNYPFQLALTPVVSALAAGNTIILKPSELTPHTSGLMAELLNGLFPPEVLFVREGGVKETTELLGLHFDKIFFTGSTHVGRIVMRAAAEHLTPVTLELGGKNPVIVLPDCDVKMTAKRLVWGKFHNGGQACVAPDYIYVHEDIRMDLLEEVKRNIIKMFAGDASQSEAFPRIINLSNFNRLMNLISKEKVILGGKGDAEGLFIEPTVLDGVSEEDPIMQEEVFGPLMPFLSFRDLETLLISLKQKASPLAFYIFTGNRKLARRVQQEFRSGGGMVNDTVVHFVNSSTPFGGVGESGMGSYHGRAGFETFTHRKTVISKPFWFELWVKYPPYTVFKLKIIKTLLK